MRAEMDCYLKCGLGTLDNNLKLKIKHCTQNTVKGRYQFYWAWRNKISYKQPDLFNYLEEFGTNAENSNISALIKLLPRVSQSAYKNITSALPFKPLKILVDLRERFRLVLVRACSIYNLGRSLWLRVVVLLVVKFEKEYWTVSFAIKISLFPSYCLYDNALYGTF